MANNTRRYGFRWATGYNGGPHPKPIRMHVASGTNFSDGTTNCPLQAGDPVKLVATGGVTNADEGDTDDIFGIVVGVGPYLSSGKMVRGTGLPSGTTWTNEENRSYVYVVPASTGFWEIDVDDAVTATTEAAYRLLIHQNANFLYDQTVTTALQPQLDISTTNTTESFQLRIVDVSPTVENQDFSGSYVKLIVAINQSNEPGRPATNAAGL